MKGANSIFLTVFLVMSTGCGGTKILAVPEPLDISTALLSATDDTIEVNLRGVIVRNSPGSWARNAYWDEYLLSIENTSDAAVQIDAVSIIDFLGLESPAISDRRELVRRSRDSVNRYADSGLKITSGLGTGTLIAAGAVVAIAGVAVTSAAAPAMVLGGTAASVGLVPVVAAGAIIMSPVFAIAGIKRLSNSANVSLMIEERATDFPLLIKPREEFIVDIFYPFAPSPEKFEIHYGVPSGTRKLILPTVDALSGLHVIK